MYDVRDDQSEPAVEDAPYDRCVHVRASSAPPPKSNHSEIFASAWPEALRPPPLPSRMMRERGLPPPGLMSAERVSCGSRRSR